MSFISGLLTMLKLEMDMDRDLHWLKVPERIQFRLCVLTYHCLHGIAPSYMAETLHLTTSVDHVVDSVKDQHRHYSYRPHDEPHLTIEHFQWPLRAPGMLCRRLSELLNRTLRSGDR